jgi:hypothetical protein
MNWNGLEEALMAYYKVLLHDLPGGTEEKIKIWARITHELADI